MAFVLASSTTLAGLRAPVRAASKTARRSVVVRAEGESEPAAPVASTSEPVVAPLEAAAPVETPAVAAVTAEGAVFPMNFSGWAPETINGRLAMVGFVAGLGAEFGTQESFPEQFAAHGFSFALAAGLFTLASFMPNMQAAEDYSANPETFDGRFGPFSAGAEKLNGRAAMIGMLGMLVIEGAKGSALF